MVPSCDGDWREATTPIPKTPVEDPRLRGVLLRVGRQLYRSRRRNIIIIIPIKIKGCDTRDTWW